MNNKEKIKLFVSSGIMFLFSLLVAYLISQIIILGLAKLFQIPVSFKNYSIVFNISNSSYLWNSITVTAIYGLPPILSLFLAIITRSIYNNARSRKSNFKLYLAWQSLSFDNLFFGGIIAGVATSSGFAYFLNWIYIPFVAQVILAVFAAAFLFYQHFFLNYAFSQSSPHRRYIDKQNQIQYKAFSVFFPFLIGTVILYFINFPDNTLHNIILRLTPLFALFQIRKYIDKDEVKLVRNSRVFSPNYAILIVIIIYFFIINFAAETYFFLKSLFVV